MPLALMRVSATPPHVTPPPPPTPTPTSPTYHLLCRDFAQTCGWSGGEARDASSALGSDEADDDDEDKATRAAIAHAYEVDRGGGGGESGAREGGEGWGRGRGRGRVVKRHFGRRS
jgi:hypothetical protein